MPQIYYFNMNPEKLGIAASDLPEYVACYKADEGKHEGVMQIVTELPLLTPIDRDYVENVVKSYVTERQQLRGLKSVDVVHF